ncbi:hypothetical protein BD626DRAFT_35261 [Schizophyllum amplum]|uniref:Uncharacterized protein n=1 Tax=Schizophyllum amplum TaxID=97359 RepID=A0A550CEK0_9AGAR|nr:hypothetical protein BD626DRAFT_35261 [Auriculariopsis ampla]
MHATVNSTSCGVQSAFKRRMPYEDHLGSRGRAKIASHLYQDVRTLVLRSLPGLRPSQALPTVCGVDFRTTRFCIAQRPPLSSYRPFASFAPSASSFVPYASMSCTLIVPGLGTSSDFVRLPRPRPSSFSRPVNPNSSRMVTYRMTHDDIAIPPTIPLPFQLSRPKPDTAYNASPVPRRHHILDALLTNWAPVHSAHPRCSISRTPLLFHPILIAASSTCQGRSTR